jgi:ATP-binding cassette subfamily C protein LapB
LIACTILGSRVISPISSGVGLIVQAQHVGQSLRAADALLDLPGESGDADDLLSPNEIRNSLTAENVRFFYTDIPVPQVDVPALEIAEGERVVLIGPPGSGKSTLLKILAGLYKPNEGRVLLGGVDIGLLDVERLREVVGYLPQDAMLFSGTLRDNLALGGAVNDDDLINLVRDLGLDELVQDHPRGLDREITEGGAGLSGGQRQMASLARLMLRRPRIWLLDEPTAGLDSGYEARVFGVLAKVLQPRDTVVIVSHRPQSIKFAQRVIVMQKGRVVHSGEREDFLARMRAASLRGREENE